MSVTEVYPDAEPTPCGCFTATEVVDMWPGKLTYRQLDYWTRKGLVPAHVHTSPHCTSGDRVEATGKGSGFSRGYDATDAVHAAVAAGLIGTFPGLGPELALRLMKDQEVAGKVDTVTVGLRLVTDLDWLRP